MNNSVSRIVPQAAFGGLVAVVVSLPLLFLVHRSLGLGNPPITGLFLLGGTVVICFALAGAVGATVGAARGKAFIAALLGLAIGGTASFIVAPFYGGIVIEGLSRDATGLVLNERGRFETRAREVAKTRGSEALTAIREGRLQEQLSNYQQQAENATTPEARAAATQKVRELGAQLAVEGKAKGFALLKSGAARTSSLSLLLWALLGTPTVAALACRGAKR